MTDISLESLMAGEPITEMLKDVADEPTSVKEIRRLIREVHEAFFGSKSDDDKTQLLLNLIQGYKLNSEEEKENYEFFDAASQQIAVFNVPLGGEYDEQLLRIQAGVHGE